MEKIKDSILALLANHSELTAHQIVTKSAYNKKRITEALGELKGAGLIVSELDHDKGVAYWAISRAGVTSHYSIDSEIEVKPESKPRKPNKPYTPNKIAGAYSYRGALVIKLDRKASAKSITLTPSDMAMLVAIHGNMG